MAADTRTKFSPATTSDAPPKGVNEHCSVIVRRDDRRRGSFVSGIMGWLRIESRDKLLFRGFCTKCLAGIILAMGRVSRLKICKYRHETLVFI